MVSAADDLSLSVEKSLRYHQRRRAHFERWHKWTMFVVIMAGSAAIAHFHPRLAGTVAALAGALDLTFSFSAKARDHELLYRRFSDLARQIRSNPSPSEDDLTSWSLQRLSIEDDEPPIYWALEADCCNEVLYARGKNRLDFCSISWHQKVLMNYCAFEKTQFLQRHELEEPSMTV